MRSLSALKAEARGWFPEEDQFILFLPLNQSSKQTERWSFIVQIASAIFFAQGEHLGIQFSHKHGFNTPTNLEKIALKSLSHLLPTNDMTQFSFLQ